MDFDKLTEDIPVRKNPYRVPGFSFGSRFETRTEEDLLGPGSYNAEPLSPKKNAVSFSRSQRFKSNLEKDNLGPGAYNISSPVGMQSNLLASPKQTARTLVSNSISFSKAQKFNSFSESNLALGPGHYDVKRDFESVSSLKNIHSPKMKKESQKGDSSQSLYNKTQKDSPGPGQYKVLEKVNAGHISPSGFSLGTSERQFLNPKSLDKGLRGSDYYKYSQYNLFGKKDGQKVSFTKEKKRDLSPLGVVPGPGTYFAEPKEEKNNFPKGTWGKAARKIHESDKMELGPGPGEYNLTPVYEKKGVKMSQAQRSKNQWDTKIRSPGPGEYDILDQFERKKKEIEKQLALSDSKLISKINNLKESGLSPKRKSPLANIIDSENLLTSFNVSDIIEKYRRHKSPPKKMWIDFEVETSISPGPKYLVQNESIERNLGTTGTKFSNLSKEIVYEDIKKNVPGPGWYDDQYRDKDLSPTSFAMSKRKENPLLPEHTLEVPGPDHYVIAEQKPKMEVSFTKALRNLEVEDSVLENQRTSRRTELKNAIRKREIKKRGL